MVSNSGMNEWGGIYGGSPGDQTGKEWNIIAWYIYSPGGWNCVLRHPDAKVRAKIAELGRTAALNNNIGYNQYNRNSYWTQLQKVGYLPAKIMTKCDADCSAGVIANTKAAGHLLGISALKNITATYTGNMRSAYRAAGFQILTDRKFTASPDYLLAGDILLNDANHVCTNLDDGRYSGGSPAPAPVTNLNLTYAVRIEGGIYLPEVVNLSDYAGIIGRRITDIAIKTNKGRVRYRAHVLGGAWLPWVTGYNWRDHANGYAGNGRPIDCIQVELAGVVGQEAQYRVSPLRGAYYPWQYNTRTGGGMDGFAGAYGKAIDRVQIF